MAVTNTTHKTYGNLAFDLDALAKELDREEVTQRIHSEQRHQERRKAQSAAKRHTHTKAAVSIRPSIPLAICFALVLTMLMTLLLGYVQLTKVSARVSTLKSEISTLDDEHLDLLTKYEKTFDLATIQKVAEASGMSKPSSGQIEYIDLSEGDTTVVYKNSTPTVFKKAAASVESGVLGVFDFFN